MGDLDKSDGFSESGESIISVNLVIKVVLVIMVILVILVIGDKYEAWSGGGECSDHAKIFLVI